MTRVADDDAWGYRDQRNLPQGLSRPAQFSLEGNGGAMPSRPLIALLFLGSLTWILAATPAADPDNAAALAQAARKVRQIIAHRGSSSDRPDNTLASYRQAIAVGAT